jgi:hypothetical protein
MSDTPRDTDPDEAPIRRPRLFASGEREEPAAEAAATAAPTDEPADEADEADETHGPEAAEVRAKDEEQAKRRRASRFRFAEVRRDPRKRRFWVIVISAGAAIVVLALCGGGVAVISAVHRATSGAAEAREDRRRLDADCLELETRLNHLTPPGASTTPVGRATAVQDENAAVRIYVNQLASSRDADLWRQLLDARTSYAGALQVQARSKAPAFYVAGRAADGQSLGDRLLRASPASCAGSVRRLVAPDL